MPGVIASTIMLQPRSAIERERESKGDPPIYITSNVVHTVYKLEPKILIQLESSKRT